MLAFQNRKCTANMWIKIHLPCANRQLTNCEIITQLKCRLIYVFINALQ